LTFLIALTAIYTLGYVLLLIYYAFHWKPGATTSNRSATFPFCSVVIAARNEELSISKCLQSIKAQTYPADKYEVIVVNDCSVDHTVERVLQFPKVHLLHTSPDKPGKKYALTKGIGIARGEIIVTTDADCRVQPGWLMSITGAFNDNTQMVTGAVLAGDVKNAYGRFQGLDLAGLSMITASGIQSGLHHLANGANMAFRKSAFLAVGGFSGNSNYASGDDVFLVQNVARTFPGGIAYAWNTSAVVFTEPCRTLSSLIQQRIRWATKNKALQQRSIYWIWAFIWMTFVLNLVTAIVILCTSLQLVGIPVILTAAVLTAEYLFLRRVVKHYEQQELLRGFALSFAMHYIYILYIGIAGALTKTYRWKDRKLR
jgi:cellulose synthase/poly-beta-1,6-N-acetylglucosamine synthase-like glycosyltransferase